MEASIALAEFLGEALECLGAAEQAGVEEIEQGPEIGQAILNGRAGQGKAGGGFEFLHGAGLARAGVLDGLGFIEDRKMPGRVRSHGRRASMP